MWRTWYSLILHVLAVCNFTIFYRLTLAVLLVTIATVLTILLNPFLFHPLNPKHAYWPKHGWSVAEKHRNNRNSLRGNHLGRHLEYLKLLKSDTSTPPHISLYTPQGWIIKREKTISEICGLGGYMAFGCRTRSRISIEASVGQKWPWMIHPNGFFF